MKRFLFVFVLLGLSACAGSPEPDSPPPPPPPPTDADRLQGSWQFEVNSLEVFAITFNGSLYEFDDIAILTDGTVGMFVELGNFTTNGRTITFEPSRASCTGAFPDYVVNYTVDATRLALLGDTTITTFVKFVPTGTGGGAQVRLGCFFEDGSFQQQPVDPV